jgi:hypothetical protein
VLDAGGRVSRRDRGIRDDCSLGVDDLPGDGRAGRALSIARSR